MKAEDYLVEAMQSVDGASMVYFIEGITAIKIAKEESLELAVRAFKDCCQYQVNDFCEYGDCECDMKALYCVNFKKKLYE